jgi:3-oxoadipate enol-lactonase
MNIAVRDVQSIEVEAGVRLAVSVSGALDKPVIVFSNSLAASYGMWEEVADRLALHACLVRYDTRGHGESDAPESGYTIETLSKDVLAVLDTFEISRAVICGVSLGGLTAMWLGIHAPDRVSGLVLANTAANFPPETMWRDRATTARSSGVASFVQPSLERWVTSEYRGKHESRVADLAAMIARTSSAGYAGCCEVLATTNLLPDLSRISCPVRVIAGRQDPSTPPARAEEIVAAIPQADLVTLDAAHISCVEAPDAFAGYVRDFLTLIKTTDKT